MLDHEMLMQNTYWQCIKKKKKKVNTSVSILICNPYWDLQLNTWRKHAFLAAELAGTWTKFMSANRHEGLNSGGNELRELSDKYVH